MSSEITTPESLIQKFAKRYSVEANKLLTTLKATAFKIKDGEVSNEHMMALLVVADQYGLNPFTREIYAFPDKNKGIIPIVGLDGWCRIINTNSEFDGLEFTQSDNMVIYEGGISKTSPEWIECIIYRKDRKHPIKIREYLDEVFRHPFQGVGTNGSYLIQNAWQTHTKRMLRHKAMIQCARIAFGFGGIYDQDEAERIIASHKQSESNKPAIQFTDDGVIQHDNDLAEAEFSPIAINDTANAEVNAQANQETITDKDKSFIAQLVLFAQQNNSWETAKDNFQERYQGQTLVYAERELSESFALAKVAS